ncbi:MAG: ABC transporter substrate-binding protein [Armatimonadota bacterium]|nr:ABC transporter substrate-binding protein [Armatimonadota bacterium]MDR7485100.1 ABC transporter substrate-binding protein [Armatimonadota bacterium]MDR7533488.1 ABC transporter substrate-binding protein [Armatimonadota bacterium]MDR7537011.1 ABC transporter substrate-binding protein [Armatimonadota bacterium]
MIRGMLVAILAYVLAAVGMGAAGAAPAVGGAFTLYTSESEDDINLLVGDFTRRHPGVQVKIFRAGSGPVVAKLQAELQGGRIQADAIWFADIAFFQDLARRDLLLAYAPPTGRRADPKLHYDGNRYHEVRLIFNVVAFNTNHVRFRPASWWDLTLPRYRGRAGMPNPFVSGAAFAHVGTFASMREFGWDYYRRLRENDARILRANGDVLRGLAAGEISIAQIVDFFVRAAKAQGSPVDHIWPQEGAVLVPTPIAIIKGTPNEAPAKAFVDYLYTPEAQRLFVQRAYVPVIPGIPLPPGAPDPSDLKIIQTNLGYIEKNREEIKRTFAELFGIQ